MTASEIISMAAAGNDEAERFCLAWVAHCQMFDDTFDRDRPVTDERMGELSALYLAELSGNQFYFQHKPMLFGLMITSINAWIDSNHRSGVERAVLSGQYHEVVYAVAYIVGGWSHLRRVTSETREYKTPAPKPQPKGKT